MNRLADTNVWNDNGSPRFVRIRRVDPRPNLIDALAAENVQRDAASHYRRQAYKLRVQKWVTGLCVAAATFAVVWFGGLELIGLVK